MRPYHTGLCADTLISEDAALQSERRDDVTKERSYE